MLLNPENVVTERAGVMRVWRRNDVALETVLDTIARPGETLKRGGKSHTRRVGRYVVKSSEGPFALQLLKHTAQRERYRQGWRAALFLERHNIPAPRAIAHVEWGVAGLLWRHATVIEYLNDCRDIERYYDAMAGAGAQQAALNAYLIRVADAVNALVSTGAIHTDLAGKNILTRDGDKFHFIDLDGIVLGEHLDEDRKLQLRVQMYDSFADRCGDDQLVLFLKAVLPDIDEQFEVWFAKVKAAQAVRRSRTVAAWKREGKL